MMVVMTTGIDKTIIARSRAAHLVLRSTRALGCRFKCHTAAAPQVLNPVKLELPLRFRGSSAEASNSTRRDALAVGAGAAGRRSSPETRCVNRHRSGEHKVPRSRAQSAGRCEVAFWPSPAQTP